MNRSHWIPILLLFSAAAGKAGVIEHELAVDPSALELQPLGRATRIGLPGYTPSAPPGLPALPTRTVRLALPVDADPTSLRWKLTDLRPGVRIGLHGKTIETGRSLRWLCPWACPGTGPLPADRPAFVFHGSCSNGTPENASNIAYTQLKSGAIASYASTRVALGGGGRDWRPDVNSADVFTMGYFVVSKLRLGQTAGQAISETRALLGDAWWGEYAWHTKLATTLYGDPTLQLANCQVDEDCDDGLFCTLADRCLDGACQGTPRTCTPLSTQCIEGVCEEDARACAAQRMPDGQECEAAGARGTCQAGLCLETEGEDCSCAGTRPSATTALLLLLSAWWLARRRRGSPGLP